MSTRTDITRYQTPKLEKYCFVASAALTVTVEFTKKGRTIEEALALTISTTAKGIMNFVDDASADWPAGADGMRILSITGGGTLHFNTAGDASGTNGVAAGLAPTTSSKMVLAGAEFGALAA